MCPSGRASSMAQAPRPTSSTSSTCQDVWCRKLTGAASTSTLWWSVEQRRNAPTSLIRSLTLKPSPSVKNDVVACWSVLPSTACPSLRGRTRSGRGAGQVAGGVGAAPQGDQPPGGRGHEPQLAARVPGAEPPVALRREAEGSVVRGGLPA